MSLASKMFVMRMLSRYLMVLTMAAAGIARNVMILNIGSQSLNARDALKEW